MGSAWKNLPEELSEPARHLAEELRAIKDAAGLSLSELATRTHYSRASWERWLNGKRVVTEQALDALIRAVDCDGAALRALWERALAAPEESAEHAEPSASAEAAEAPDGPGAPSADEPAAGGPAADGSSPDEPSDGEPEEALVTGQAPGPGPVAWWRRPAALVTGATLLAVLLVLVGLRAARHDGQPTAVAEPAPTAAPAVSPAASATTAKPVPATPTCQAMGCDHKDPKNTGCGKDARTLHTDVIGKVVIYLRYSQKCQAAWAAITEGEPGDFATIIDSTGDSEQGLIHYGYDNYSNMLNAADPTIGFHLCGHQPAGDICTSEVFDLAAVVDSTPIPIGPASPPPGTGAGAATAPAAPAPTDTAPAAAPGTGAPTPA
ncbi:helix-turn-helix domain-containing protein [Kitasatospora sp. NPDC059599]|uniref:helix-turn-helix domain-containing protein n=1 Tax=Kitasatospora sp. NPDC059599 TaxID=3346880 RepID=UPI0036AEE636